MLEYVSTNYWDWKEVRFAFIVEPRLELHSFAGVARKLLLGISLGYRTLFQTHLHNNPLAHTHIFQGIILILQSSR